MPSQFSFQIGSRTRSTSGCIDVGHLQGAEDREGVGLQRWTDLAGVFAVLPAGFVMGVELLCRFGEGDGAECCCCLGSTVLAAQGQRVNLVA